MLKMKVLCAFACLVVVVNAAPLQEERFLPFGSVAQANSEAVAVGGGDASAAASASASASSADVSPTIVTQGGHGKNIKITITKEITKDFGHGDGSVAAAGHDATAHVHPPHNATAHQHPAHVVAPHQHPGHAGAQVTLDENAVLLDNETIPDVLQQLLAGNIQNVQSHGQPLTVPPHGKPVAVIFSSSMHVVDLGEIKPVVTTAAPVPVHAAHEHPAHNHTDHSLMNVTNNVLSTLLSPLSILSSHLHTAQAVPPTVVVVPSKIQTQQQEVLPIELQQAFIDFLKTKGVHAELDTNADLTVGNSQIDTSAAIQTAVVPDETPIEAVAIAASEVPPAAAVVVSEVPPAAVAANEVAVVPVVALAPGAKKTKTKSFSISISKTKHGF